MGRAEAGFTLIEVVCALGIVALVFTTLLGTHRASLAAAGEARWINRAVALAGEVMVGVRGGLSPYAEQGSGEQGGMLWRIEHREGLLPEVEEIDVEISAAGRSGAPVRLVSYRRRP